jgi:hypothetical protein
MSTVHIIIDTQLKSGDQVLNKQVRCVMVTH